MSEIINIKIEEEVVNVNLGAEIQVKVDYQPGVATDSSTHNHDSRYYTEDEVDGMFATVPTLPIAQADVTGLVTDLANKAATSHNHDGVYEPADATILKDSDIGVSVAAALGADDNYVTDAEKVILSNTSGTNTGNENVGTIGTLVNGATAKTVPIDADIIGYVDTQAFNILKKLTWANVKAFLKSYFDSLYSLVDHNHNLNDLTEKSYNSLTDKPSIATLPITIGDVTNLTTELSGKAATSHNHNLNDLTEKSYNSLTDKPTIPTLPIAQSDVTGLVADLGNKAATSHNHNLNDLTEKSYNSLTEKPTIPTLPIAQSDVTGLVTDLSNKAATSHNHNLNDLTEKSYNSLTEKPTIPTLPITIGDVTNLTMELSGKAATSHNHTGVYAPVLGADDNYVTDAEKTKLSNLSGTNSGNETTTTIGSLVNGATAKTTPVDADMVGLMDSAASNILKKLSWLNIKATLKTYFDTLYAAISHNHAASEITSGTLGIAQVPTITVAKGGTNQTSYTKGDILAASSSSVLTKLGVGANDTVLMADSAQSTGMKWATPAGGAGITVYPVTTADAENTTSEIDVISFTVPANTWKDGEKIEVYINTQGLNNSGSNRWLQLRAKVQSTIVILSEGNIASSATQGNATRKITFTRMGSVVTAENYFGSTGLFGGLPFTITGTGNYNNLLTDTVTDKGSRFTTFNFAAAIPIILSAQWSVANANLYYRILEATAYKLNS